MTSMRFSIRPRLLVPVLLALLLSGCGLELDPPAPSERYFPTEGHELAAAIEHDDQARFEQLVAGGADLSVVGPEGMTFLQFALQQDRAHLADRLLQLGADPNQPGWTGQPPLQAATPDTELMSIVLTAGADPNGRNSQTGATALGGSCVQGEAFDLLIAAGADVNPADHNGGTPLQQCAMVNQGAQVLRLLELGADPLAETSNGSTFQDYYFGYDNPAFNERSHQERRAVVAWLVAHGYELHPGAEKYR